MTAVSGREAPERVPRERVDSGRVRAEQVHSEQVDSEQLHEVLAGNRYPGRGVLWARTLDGSWCAGYFLTGRSAASRARSLHRDSGASTGGVSELTVAPTSASDHDPLRHYAAVRERQDGWLVYGNGEQVAEVAELLDAGRTPAEAMAGLAYEPDPPIFTPRITVAVDLRPEGRADAAAGADAGPVAWFGAARRSRGGRTAPDLLTLAVRGLAPGDAVLITTYRSDGQRVETGEPFVEARTGAADAGALLEEVWGALAAEYRVAATVFEPGRLVAGLVRHRADTVAG